MLTMTIYLELAYLGCLSFLQNLWGQREERLIGCLVIYLISHDEIKSKINF